MIRLALLAGVLAGSLAAGRAEAQDRLQGQGELAAINLPDAPEPAGGLAADGQDPKHARVRGYRYVATQYDKVVQPDELAPRLTVPDKVLMGLRSSVSLVAVTGWVFSAGYEQAIDGSPNYGQTATGFAQRLGAASARATSENIFATSVLSPIFHEDPRYYVMGHRRNVFVRAVYAATRSVVTRRDDGGQTLNLGEIGGNLVGSSLTQLYYPAGNRGLGQTMKTFGGSMEGSALGFVVREFLAGSPALAHLKLTAPDPARPPADPAR